MESGAAGKKYCKNKKNRNGADHAKEKLIQWVVRCNVPLRCNYLLFLSIRPKRPRSRVDHTRDQRNSRRAFAATSEDTSLPLFNIPELGLWRFCWFSLFRQQFSIFAQGGQNRLALFSPGSRATTPVFVEIERPTLDDIGVDLLPLRKTWLSKHVSSKL